MAPAPAPSGLVAGSGTMVRPKATTAASQRPQPHNRCAGGHEGLLVFALVLPPCFPENKRRRASLAKDLQALEFSKKTGAGEGIRTIDPNLGKVAIDGRSDSADVD